MIKQIFQNYKYRVITQIFVLVSFVIVFLLSKIFSLKVDYPSFIFFFVIPACLYIGTIVCIWRKDKILAPILELVAAGFLISLPILISTYLVMSFAMPMADEHLTALDNALGFEWLPFIQYVDSKPWLAKLLQEAYTSFETQLLFVIIFLASFKRLPKACAFIISFGVLCFISNFIAIWYPPLGTYAVAGMDGTSLQNINVYFGYHFLESFNNVRTDPDFVVAMGTVSGIITFPSVHAGVAFLIIWAMWDVKLLRYPFLIWNILMAVSAITHGSHYLVDIIASVGVAGITVTLVSFFFLHIEKPGFMKAGKKLQTDVVTT